MNMEEYTIYCSAEQTKRALKLGAPIKNVHYNNDGGYEYADNPTAEQMLEWLKTNGFVFGITDYNDGFNDHVFWRVSNQFDKKWYVADDKLKDPKEAVLAAIDAALDYLKNKKGGNNEKSIV